MGKFAQRSDARYDASKRTWHYEVVGLSVPIVFNQHRDHDPNGMLYALATHRPELERLAARWRALIDGERTVAELAELTAHPLVRPLVLRARVGDTIVVRFTNYLQGRCAGMHLVAPGTDVHGDGSHVTRNPSSLAGPGETIEYEWRCPHEGAFVIHDIGARTATKPARTRTGCSEPSSWSRAMPGGRIPRRRASCPWPTGSTSTCTSGPKTC